MSEFHGHPSVGSRVVPCGRTDKQEETQRWIKLTYLRFFLGGGYSYHTSVSINAFVEVPV